MSVRDQLRRILKVRAGNRKEKVEDQVGESAELAENENLVSNCPVCMEACTSEGSHRVCCIPCGYVYGRLCLEKWLKKCGNRVGKCPQCRSKFKRTNIINLYALKIGVPNDDLQKISGTESTDALKSQIANLRAFLQNQDEQLAKIKFILGHDWKNKLHSFYIQNRRVQSMKEIEETLDSINLKFSALKLKVKAFFDDIMTCFKTPFNKFSRLLSFKTR